MGILDWLILAALAAWGVFALRAMRRAKKRGGCSGCCAGCSAHCGACGTARK